MKLISLHWRLHARPVADLIRGVGRFHTGLTSAQERRAVYIATLGFVIGLLVNIAWQLDT